MCVYECVCVFVSMSECGSVHVCMCSLCIWVCMCALLLDFCPQDRYKAVAKLDLLLLKKCSVFAGLSGCHHCGDALGTGTLMRPLLASCLVCVSCT